MRVPGTRLRIPGDSCAPLAWHLRGVGDAQLLQPVEVVLPLCVRASRRARTGNPRCTGRCRGRRRRRAAPRSCRPGRPSAPAPRACRAAASPGPGRGRAPRPRASTRAGTRTAARSGRPSSKATSSRRDWRRSLISVGVRAAQASLSDAAVTGCTGRGPRRGRARPGSRRHRRGRPRVAVAVAVGGLVADRLEQPLHHRVQAAGADVLGALVDVERDLGDAPDAAGVEVQRDALGRQQRGVLRAQRGVRLGEDAARTPRP